MPPKFAKKTGERQATRSSRDGSGSGQPPGELRGDADFDEDAAQTLKQHPAEYGRVAARARRLAAEATTSRVKQYLRELIDQCERLADEAEEASRNLG